VVVPDYPGLDPDIAAHYQLGIERMRLRKVFRLEFARMLEILARYLPPPPATIFDIGGGMGAYALPLAADGYEVHLLDPVELHVREARSAWALLESRASDRGRLAEAVVGDARELPFEDESADAVLLLGPLYHLTQPHERLTALRQALRVLRPGGPMLAASISAFASTYDGLTRGFLAEPGFEEIVEGDVRDGEHRNPTGRPDWFTTAFFHRPEELRDEVQQAGFALDALLAVEGPGSALADVNEWLDDPQRRELLLRAIRRVETEPSLLGASAHVLAVARRPSST
jgi:ubiquinone/menaquinone biosynthesis C-methylase UbiE